MMITEAVLAGFLGGCLVGFIGHSIWWSHMINIGKILIKCNRCGEVVNKQVSPDE